MLELLSKLSKEGIPLPAAYDAASDKPSSTLWFMYLANTLALGSIIYLDVKDPTAGTVAACLYAVVSSVLYMMRRLQKAKFDLDDKAIELESSEEPEEKHDNP